MNDLLRIKTIKKFFEFDEFRLFADAISHGVLIMNNEGRVSLANKFVQKIFFKNEKELTPFTHYSDLIDNQNQAIVDLIEDTLSFKQNIYRQIPCHDKTYLADSQVVFKDDRFIGCSISITDVTTTVARDRQHELLYQISTALSGIASVEQILKIAVSQVKQSMPFEAVNVMLYDPIKKVLKIKADSNEGQEARVIKMGEGVAGRAAIELKPYSIYDIATSDLFTQKNDNDKGALLVIPIASKGRLFGVLNVRDSEPRYFTENEVQFLTIVANEMAIAIENSLLYQRLKRRIQQLYKIFWASSFIGTRSIDNRLQRIAKLVPDLFESEGCAIYLYSSAENALTLKYHSDQGARLPLTAPMSALINSEKNAPELETIIVNTPRDEDESAFFAKYALTSLITIPMYVNNHPVGIMKIFNKKTGRYDDEDKTMSTIIAHRLAAKIENAHLMNRVESEKELLNKIIENTSEGVVVINRNHKIVVWNQYMEHLTGLTKEKALGYAAYKIFLSELGLKNLTKDIYSSNDERKSFDSAFFNEHQLKNIHGDKIWIGAVYSYILDKNQNTDYTILVIRNISKEKEFIQAKEEFVSVTTHELRTPLTAIRGYLSMINNGDVGTLSEKQHTYFSKAFAATERLSLLIEELLYVFRIDEDRITYEVDNFSITDVIQASVDDMIQPAKSKGIQLLFDSTAPLKVCADPVKTKQILDNLIDNAIKYTKSRGKITVSIEKREHDVMVAIKDTGVGIPSKHLPHVFDRFVRIPNPLSVKAGGAGLGLYIVKNLVEKQGGTIWATSQVGKESVFYFTLPLATVTEPRLQKKGAL